MGKQVCACGDHTSNRHGVCDICRMMPSPAQWVQIGREPGWMFVPLIELFVLVVAGCWLIYLGVVYGFL